VFTGGWNPYGAATATSGIINILGLEQEHVLGPGDGVMVFNKDGVRVALDCRAREPGRSHLVCSCRRPNQR